MAFLAPLASQAAPIVGSLIASQAPTLMKIGKQAAMAIGKKGISEIMSTISRQASSQAGRESLLNAASKGARLGVMAGHEVLGAAKNLGILGGRSYNRYTGGLERFGSSAQKAMGSLFKINRKFSLK